MSQKEEEEKKRELEMVEGRTHCTVGRCSSARLNHVHISQRPRARPAFLPSLPIIYHRFAIPTTHSLSFSPYVCAILERCPESMLQDLVFFFLVFFRCCFCLSNGFSEKCIEQSIYFCVENLTVICQSMMKNRIDLYVVVASFVFFWFQGETKHRCGYNPGRSSIDF